MNASVIGTGDGFLIALEDQQRNLRTLPFRGFGALPAPPFSGATNDKRRPRLWRTVDGIAMGYEKLETGVPRIYF